MKFSPVRSFTPVKLMLATSTMVLLSACGSGSDTSHADASTSGTATGVTTLHLVSPGAVSQAQQTVLPGFHVAPVILEAPGDEDSVDNAASSRRAPVLHDVPGEFRGLQTSHLTLQKMELIHRGEMSASDTAADPSATPMSTSGVITYTPAQIRAAYALPALPANGASLSATQAAALGAGQTIYLIDAMNDPNVAAELAAFNQKFGLPSCATTTISASAHLPLATASAGGCQFSVVYSTDNGGMTSTAPAYDSGWATEITLDVQWSHATAPLARIILIEAADASTSSLVGAINLANAMGQGAVSMSFGTPEGSWTASEDGAFTTANMSYLAATGDSGAGVGWPAVSSHVLAVGGTSLTYSGTGNARSETAWSDTGGGISAYVARPSYQSNSVPDMGSQAYRAVADVSFNANPNTGQYLAVISPGSSNVSWLSAGGTSLATPQWAGVVAIANAQRALTSKAALGAPHAALYGQVASVSGSYSSAFLDVSQGSDGSCASCTAHAGYDELTGLGTPNVSSLLTLLGGASANPPVVTSAAISGTVGTALTFTVSATAPDALTYSLSGQPSGMTINSNGAVSWATPVAGTYSVTVTAKDSKTGLSGAGVYTITIAKPVAPVVSAQSISGKVGTALSFEVAVTSTDAVTVSLTHQPGGMSINTQGLVTWSAPALGTYSVTVTAKDSKTGLSGSAVVTVVISAQAAAQTQGPVITATTMTGRAGQALTGTIKISDTNVAWINASISGVPLGMTFSFSGLSITANWANPVSGSYVMKVQVTDSAGLTTQLSIPITVAAS